MVLLLLLLLLLPLLLLLLLLLCMKRTGDQNSFEETELEEQKHNGDVQ